jgi:hypothetical protein
MRVPWKVLGFIIGFAVLCCYNFYRCAQAALAFLIFTTAPHMARAVKK